MRFFFYGTLIDPDVRRLVMRTSAPARVEPAVLAGWERRAVRGAVYPIIVARRGGTVDGVLARGIDAAGRQRLIAYEGDGYDLAVVDVTLDAGRRKTALVFAPSRDGGITPAANGWTFETWARRHKRAFLQTIADGG